MTIAALFQQAVQAFQSRNYAAAEQLCQQINQQQPQADVLHMLALCARQRHDTAAAERYFQQSLKLQAQPTIRANYANFLVSEQRYTDAVEQFNHLATQQQLTANSAQQYIWTLGQLQQLERALETALAQLQLHPQNAPLLFQVGQLWRQLGQPERALSYLQQACALSKPIPVRYGYALACVEYDIDKVDAAEQRLTKLIQAQPDLIEAHQALNQLYWEQGRTDKFGQSYVQARHQKPDSLGLLHAQVSQWLLAENFTKAQELIESAPNSLHQDPDIQHLRAVIYARQNRHDAARKAFIELAQAHPYHFVIQKSAASACLRAGQYKAALGYLDRAHELEPLQQEVIAYQALAWRLLDDPRANWLNNPAFIQAIPLPIPAGYANPAVFMDALAEALSGLHKAQRQPLDQSVRHGTQTMGHLLGIEHPVIQAFKQSLTQATERYLAQLPDDPTHPFLSRKQGSTANDFRFTGAWSVKLTQQGFHTNHVHPQGWLSCCSYIRLPEEVQADDPQHRGWIQFGETSMDLGQQEQILLRHCPKPGEVVFFPSYFWHGTVALTEPGERLTIPVDISPM